MPSTSLTYLSIGSLGTGFSEASLKKGVANGITFIGADAGSTDGGPAALSGAGPGWSTVAYERDLRLLMIAAHEAGVPLLVGSCGTSGRDWGVDFFAEIAREIAKEQGIHPKIARIYSEVTSDLVIERLKEGRVHPLEPAPPYDEETARRSTRIVGVMGVEPFQAALEQGADIVLAGRATDTAIFAAIPLAHGVNPGLAWHAGKIAECGTGSTEPRRRLDVLQVTIEDDSFIVQPLADDIRCTPFSVAAIQLHEVADPFTLVEPGWIADLSGAQYEAVSDRAVRVSGSTAKTAPYTVKLEGVESAGFQRMFMFSIRDPTILAEIDVWMNGIESDVAIRCEEMLGKEALAECQTHVRLYGRDGTMGSREPIKVLEGHEAVLICDVVAPTEEICATVASTIWYSFMHHKSPGWRGNTTLAWPFARSVHDLGEVFRFNVNHVIDVDDPLEMFRIELEEV